MEKIGRVSSVRPPAPDTQSHELGALPLARLERNLRTIQAQRTRLSSLRHARTVQQLYKPLHGYASQSAVKELQVNVSEIKGATDLAGRAWRRVSELIEMGEKDGAWRLGRGGAEMLAQIVRFCKNSDFTAYESLCEEACNLENVRELTGTREVGDAVEVLGRVVKEITEMQSKTFRSIDRS